MDVNIRWLIRRDRPEVLEIERQSFEFPWTDDDFQCCLKQKNCMGMVAEYQQKILGFMIYELLKSQIHVLNFAVMPRARRCSIGSQLVDRLKRKLSEQRRTEIVLEVRESNLAAQKFFHSCGLWAYGVIRGHYEDTEEDAYMFRYVLETADAVVQSCEDCE